MTLPMHKQPDKVPMQTNRRMAAAPRYLLLEGRNPVGPEVAPTPSGNTCLAVYAFSGKPAYDRFVAVSNRELKPYPLVKGYLQDLTAATTTVLNLLVLDAGGPGQPVLAAVTMNAALLAQSAKADHVDAEYQLNLVPQTGSYRVVTDGDDMSDVNRRFSATDGERSPEHLS